jgi:phenylacetate-coenzyme A ligase PaaK-like adenylate-forming protein
MNISTLDSWINKKIAVPAAADPLRRVDLEAWQVDQFNRTLALAREKSPFYRQLMKQAPDKISSLAEICLFPFTSQADLSAFPQRFVCVSQDEVERVVTLFSSGTSGEAKRVYFSAADQELTIDFFGVGMSNLTRPGERVLILFPGERPGGIGDLLRRGLIRCGRVPVPSGMVDDPKAVLAIMHAQRIDCLAGSPTQILGLAVRSAAAGFAPRTVLLSADYVPGALVKRIQQAWNCEVYNHYGSTEMGLGGGVECEVQRGCHLREADLLFEIIDPRSGSLLPEGEYGEVVFSTLTRQAMPLIRYRTGDQARFLPGACPCGSALRTMEKVQGRYSAFILVGDRSLKLADFDEALFPLADLLNFTVTVEGRRARPFFRIDAQFLTNKHRREEVLDRLKASAVFEGLNIEAECHFNPEETGSLKKRVFNDRRSLEA